MALSEKKVTKIKVDFEAGLSTKTKIANQHKIDRLTLYNLADKHQWVYGKNKQKFNEITEQKTIERLIEKEVDISTKVNEQFQKHVTYIEGLTMSYMLELGEGKKKSDKGQFEEEGEDGKPKKSKKQSKEEADRIFSLLKPCKIASEIMNMNYSGKRKMLGMDRNDDKQDLNINVTSMSTDELIKLANSDPGKEAGTDRTGTEKGSGQD